MLSSRRPIAQITIRNHYYAGGVLQYIGRWGYKQTNPEMTTTRSWGSVGASISFREGTCALRQLTLLLRRRLLPASESKLSPSIPETTSSPPHLTTTCCMSPMVLRRAVYSEKGFFNAGNGHPQYDVYSRSMFLDLSRYHTVSVTVEIATRHGHDFNARSVAQCPRAPIACWHAWSPGGPSTASIINV